MLMTNVGWQSSIMLTRFLMSLILHDFVESEEVERLSALKDQEINEAKKVAAFEITKLIHGEEEARKAEEAAAALFGNGGNLDNMPTTKIENVDMIRHETLESVEEFLYENEKE